MEWRYQVDELAKVAAEAWQAFSQKNIWALHGDMGVGKTTFVQALCHQVLGTPDNVSSPTFALINQYEQSAVGTICHIDLYRLRDTEEAVNAGVEDAMEAADLALVEWPEQAPELFDGQTLHLYFTLLPDGMRRLAIDV